MPDSTLLTLILYFGGFIAIFYVFIIQPIKKQQKSPGTTGFLAKGEKVVTIGGIKGNSPHQRQDHLAQVNDNTEIEFLKAQLHRSDESRTVLEATI